MAYYTEKIYGFYQSITTETDPRIKEWPLIQSPVPGSLLIIAYLTFLYLGPKWMANRPPLNIKPIIFTYNFSMVVYSAFVTYQFILGSYETGFSLSCNWTTDYSDSPGAIRMAGAIWYFFIAKFIELLDTIFFILKKKNSQVTFLHVFHHGCLPMFWWWGVRAVPGGFGTFHAMVNCCVHVVMYLYYGIASLGPKYQKYIWWKRYVTLIQLAQFFIVTVHNSQFLFYDCTYPWKYAAFIQGFTLIVAILFLNFYIRTYRRSSKAYPEKNGHVNGFYLSGDSTVNGHLQSPNGISTDTSYNLRVRKSIKR